jgi:hypothetical protein
MHRQPSPFATLVGLICMGPWSSGFAAAHGASGGNSSAGHAGHGRSHHRAGWHRERGVGAYEQVQPPAGLAESINSETPVLRDLFVFPNGGQTIEQLKRDREECHRWAADQVGLDPKVAAKRAKFLRADGACLEARDYSVE